jgi:hypothetical protein
MTAIWPFRHFGLKIWSVVLAVALWLAVTGDESVERGLRVPLELQQFPAGLELQGDAPRSSTCVRGESSALGASVRATSGRSGPERRGRGDGCFN